MEFTVKFRNFTDTRWTMSRSKLPPLKEPIGEATDTQIHKPAPAKPPRKKEKKIDNGMI